MSGSKARLHELCCWSNLHGFGEILLVSRERRCVFQGCLSHREHSQLPQACLELWQRLCMKLHCFIQKGKKKNQDLNKLQAQYKTPKPIILSLGEMKHKLSPHGINTEPDTHSLPPVLPSCSISLQSALLQPFNLRSIINPEPFVKPHF